MKNYLKTQEKVTIIFGDSHDDISPDENICILHKNGKFSSLWHYLTPKYELGGYNERDNDNQYAEYTLHYTQIRVSHGGKEKKIEGSFDYQSQELHLDNHSITKFLLSFLGKEVSLTIHMAKNKKHLETNLEKEALSHSLKPQKKRVKISKI